jgi:hypothetical protein
MAKATINEDYRTGSKLKFGGEIAGPNFQAYQKQGIVDNSEAKQAGMDVDLITKGAKLTIDTYNAYERKNVLDGAADEVNVIRDDQIERSYGNQAEMAKQLEAEQNSISEKTLKDL